MITGYVTHMEREAESFRCANCMDTINAVREVRTGEIAVCIYCECELGIKADEAAAYREAYGRKLDADETRWLMVDQAHAEALDMETAWNSGRLYTGAVETDPEASLPNVAGRWSVYRDGGLHDASNGYGATWAYPLARSLARPDWMRGKPMMITVLPDDGSPMLTHKWTAL